MRKQILFMIDSLTCGGAEKSLISLLPLLDYNKYDVDLMMVNKGGVFEQYIPKEVNVIPFDGYRLTFNGWLMRLWFSFLLRWNKLIGKQVHGAELLWDCFGSSFKPLKKEYDVAIAYQQGFPTYYVAEKVCAKKKISWVNADITKVGYRASFNRPFYDKMDYVCPVSDRLCEILRKSEFVDSSKLYTVYDIINPTLIKEMANTPIGKNSLSEGFTFTTVGRMVALKGYDMAVEAARILKEKGLNFKWNFVGDGGERDAVEKLVEKYGLEENITLWGMQPNPYPYMKACDIYVQCSRFEGFGLTIAEAKILGKPVVSTNFDVVHDQLTHEHNGLIAEMTPESIAENILRLVNDNDLREKIIANVKQEENTTYATEIKKVERMIGL